MSREKESMEGRKKLCILLPLMSLFSLCFLNKGPHFDFALGLANYVAGPNGDIFDDHN